MYSSICDNCRDLEPKPFRLLARNDDKTATKTKIDIICVVKAFRLT